MNSLRKNNDAVIVKLRSGSRDSDRTMSFSESEHEDDTPHTLNITDLPRSDISLSPKPRIRRVKQLSGLPAEFLANELSSKNVHQRRQRQSSTLSKEFMSLSL
jgi:hypothetical protein